MDLDIKRVKKPRLQASGSTADPPKTPTDTQLPDEPVAAEPTQGTQQTESISDQDIAAAFSGAAPEEDPTDLTLDSDKTTKPLPEEPNRPFQQNMPKKKASKKHIIILLALLIIVAIGGAASIVLPRLLNKDEQPVIVDVPEGSKTEPQKPQEVPAPLTGLNVPPERVNRAVTAIMIENSLDARPQSGLPQADMIFEAVAEGGITRFVALFQSSLADQIGPIRSARPYYVDIARTFDAAYVHAGGSPDALARIAELGVKDMSAFESNDTYTRVDFRDAPHDLYSSSAKLNERAGALGFNSSTFETWKRKSDTPQTPTASNVSFSVSSALYNPSFSYDLATNSYLRAQNSEAHTDLTTSKQISPKVVIALVTAKGQDGIYSTYRLTGSGEIRVFQDGIVSEGTWSKDAPQSQFVFKDKNGLDFYFNRGQVWVTLVGSATDAVYSP